MATPALQPNQPPGAPPLAGQPPQPPLGGQQQPDEKAAAPFSTEELQQKYGETEKKVKAINDESGALQPPKMDLAPPPQAKQTNPVQVWGSAAMFLATVGSLLTRTPMTTALNSASKVMDSFKKQDQEEMNTAFETWKVANENAIKQQNFQMEAYKAALQKAEKDETAAISEFTAYAHAFGDHTAAKLGEERNLIMAKHLVIDQAKATSTIEEQTLKITEMKAGLNNYLDLNAAHMKLAQANASKDPKAIQAATDELQQATQRAQDYQTAIKGKGGGAGALDTETLDEMADQALSGDTSVLQGLGYGETGANNRAQLRMMMTKKMKAEGLHGADIAMRNAEFFGLKAMERTAGTRSAAIEIAADEAGTFATQAKAASANVPREDWKFVNDAIQKGQTETKNPKLRAFLIANDALVNARARAISPTGSPHIADQIEGRMLLSTAFSSGDYESGVDQMMLEVAGMKAAPGNVRQHLRETVLGGGAAGGPKPGTVEDGYTFKGGDPKDQSNWVKQ